MLISKLIEDLQRVLEEEGDLEVTMVGTLLPEKTNIPGLTLHIQHEAFESTVEGMRVVDDDHPTFGKRLKIHWQT